MLDSNRRSAVLAVVLALAAVPAAGASSVLTVTFDEAVDRALENNRDVRRAATAILRAEALLLGARAGMRPTIEASLAETRIDKSPNFGGQDTQPATQFQATALAAVPVLDAATWAARAQAGDQLDIARLAEHEVRRQIGVAAAQAYLEVVARRRQLEVERRARDTAEAQLDYARTRFEGGVGSKLNALRAAEELATSEVLVARARLALTLAREALGLVLAADAAVDAGPEPYFELPEEPGDEWLSERTDIRLLTAQRDAADRVLRDSWKDWVPTLELSFTPRYVDPTGLFERDASWRAVLGANIPIYDGGLRRARRHQRAAERDTAEVELDQAGLRARAEERASRAAIAAAEAGVASARLAARHAGEVLEITEVAFQAGSTTNIELIVAQRRARDSETAAASAEDILRRAKLDLLVAVGRFP